MGKFTVNIVQTKKGKNDKWEKEKKKKKHKHNNKIKGSGFQMMILLLTTWHGGTWVLSTELKSSAGGLILQLYQISR